MSMNRICYSLVLLRVHHVVVSRCGPHINIWECYHLPTVKVGWDCGQQLLKKCTTTKKISDFDYDLPPELIAQTPIEPRDASRLLVVNRREQTFEHRHFRDIGEYLRP